MLAPEDISTGDGVVTCEKVVSGAAVGLARHAYTTVIRYFLELGL